MRIMGNNSQTNEKAAKKRKLGTVEVKRFPLEQISCWDYQLHESKPHNGDSRMGCLAADALTHVGSRL